MKKKKIITKYARMWPREVFDIFEENALALKTFQDLKSPGVYILYRDDTPYYVGKTSRGLFKRLHDHANKTTDRYFNFWNYFSVFVVPDSSHLDEIEGILIASMPTANSATRRIQQIKIPQAIAKILRAVRRKAVSLSTKPEKTG